MVINTVTLIYWFFQARNGRNLKSGRPLGGNLSNPAAWAISAAQLSP